MFGYVVINPDTLDKELQDRYQALYCGLCHCLKGDYGLSGRMTLAYDMIFLSMLLASLYNEEEQSGHMRCPVHPVKGSDYVVTPSTEYAADLNLLLAYYKCLDDWNDDKNPRALAQSRTLEKHMRKAREKWPVQGAAIEDCLAALGEMEKSNELNPDLPTNCFGALMGMLCVRQEDEYSDTLRALGSALGRFIYLLDASNDLRADIKKQRYNPLVAQTDTDFTPVLTMMIGECTQAFEKLPIERDLAILRNVLYSGVWIQHRRRKEQSDAGSV